MRRTRRRKLKNVLVTGRGPVTGEQYLKLQEKLRLELGEFQALMGITMKEHYLITQDPQAPLADPGLCLHLRLIDDYPELVDPEVSVLDLVQTVKQLKRDYPDLNLPMSPTLKLVGLMLGRNATTAPTWSSGRVTPPHKIMVLVRHLLTLLEERDDPDRVLQHYCELIDQEAQARGMENIFTERRWP